MAAQATSVLVVLKSERKSKTYIHEMSYIIWDPTLLEDTLTDVNAKAAGKQATMSDTQGTS